MIGQDNVRIAMVGVLGFLAMQIAIAWYGIGSVAATFVGPWFIGGILIYVAYMSMKRSRTLYSPTFRRQSRGIALVSLGASLVFLTGAMNGAAELGNPAFALIQGTIAWVWLLTVFYWIDVSVRTGKRSDPIARDTMHWQSIRLPLWVANAGAVVIGTIASVYFLVIGDVAFLIGPPPSVVTASYALLGLVSNLPQVLTLGTGLVVLPVVARRSKDKVLRRHLVWFGVFALVLLLGTVTMALVAALLPSNIAFCPYGYQEQAGKCMLAVLSSSALLVETTSESAIYVLWLVAAIALNKSAKSLVPLVEVERSEGGEFIQAYHNPSQDS